jgi:FkbM family methyltransferase
MGHITTMKALSGPGKTRLYATLISLVVFFSVFGNPPFHDAETLLIDYAKPVPALSTRPVEKHLGVRNAIRKTSGEGWEMWNRQAVMNFDWTCRWGTFRATNGVTAPMCLHPGSSDIFVSNSIMGSGRWGDCDRFTTLWQYSGDGYSGDGVNGVNEKSVYVDIGGNIGSCVMQMLLTTEAPIIVFEPDPRNLYCVTQTLMALSQELRDRVSLFPIALGSEKGSSTINTAQGNMGNAVIGSPIKDTPGQQFREPIPIRIERLDSILNTNDEGWNVPVMKVDAQGFECRIMDGMGAVLDRITAIGTEVAQRWLVGQGCSDVVYLDKLRAAGFDIKHSFNHRANSAVSLIGKPLDHNQGGYDVVAVSVSRPKSYPI